MTDTSTVSGLAARAIDHSRLTRDQRVNFTERVVALAHREAITPGVALQWLSGARLTADEHAMRDAIDAMGRRDGLIAGSLDPYDVCEASPSVHVRNLRDWAISEQELQLADAIKVLSAPPTAGAR